MTDLIVGLPRIIGTTVSIAKDLCLVRKHQKHAGLSIKALVQACETYQLVWDRINKWVLGQTNVPALDKALFHQLLLQLWTSEQVLGLLQESLQKCTTSTNSDQFFSPVSEDMLRAYESRLSHHHGLITLLEQRLQEDIVRKNVKTNLTSLSSIQTIDDRMSMLDRAIRNHDYITAHAILRRKEQWFSPSFWSDIREGTTTPELLPFLKFLHLEDKSLYFIFMQTLAYTCGTDVIHQYVRTSGEEVAKNTAGKMKLPIATAARARDRIPQSTFSTLALASREGNHEVVEFLLTRDRSFVTDQFLGENPFRIAVRQCHIQVVSLFLEHAKDLIDCEVLDTALLDAAKPLRSMEKETLKMQRARVCITEILLRNGASVNAVDTVGRSALMLAVDSQSPEELVRLLLRYGADADCVDSFGVSSLFAALQLEDFRWAKVLLAKKARKLHAGASNTILPFLLRLQKTEAGRNLCNRLRAHEDLDVREIDVPLVPFSLWHGYDQGLQSDRRTRQRMQKKPGKELTSVWIDTHRPLPVASFGHESTTMSIPTSTQWTSRTRGPTASNDSNTVEKLYSHLSLQKGKRPLPMVPLRAHVRQGVSTLSGPLATVNVYSRPSCIQAARTRHHTTVYEDVASPSSTRIIEPPPQPSRLPASRARLQPVLDIGDSSESFRPALSALSTNRPSLRSSNETDRRKRRESGALGTERNV